MSHVVFSFSVQFTVKEWMKIKPREKIAKGKETERTFSNAAIQADLHTPPDTQIISLKEDKMEQPEDEMLLEELEVNTAALSDSSGNSDYDSDFDEQYDFWEICPSIISRSSFS